jgi:hypothetical protein
MNEEEIIYGQVVKVNPFTIDEAVKVDNSTPFEGESEITQVVSRNIVRVRRSNNWRRKYLLFKGVDYDN